METQLLRQRPELSAFDGKTLNLMLKDDFHIIPLCLRWIHRRNSLWIFKTSGDVKLSAA